MNRLWQAVDTGHGWCAVVRSKAGLVKCALPAPDRTSAVACVSPEAAECNSDDLLSEATRLLRRYFSGRRVGFDLPLALEGMTDFARRVMGACAQIDYGQTRSYAQVAAAVGSPRAARAVGQALARNPLPVIVPCHRVIGSDGSVVGFSAGIEWKLRLLEMEGVDLRRLRTDRRWHEGGVDADAQFS